MSSTKSKIQTRGSEQQVAARSDLLELFENNPLPPEQLLTNLLLFTRASVLAKVFYLNELYQNILDKPGIIIEFGVWWGQNLALFESLRAIHEPYNYTRRVVGFDTFTGYESISAEDGNSQYVRDGAYSVSESYEDFLARLLDYHQRENSMPQIKKYELIKGDAGEKIVEYLRSHPETIIALAYFDMQLYKPTKECLQAIKPHLTRGSVIAMDEINSAEFPGETIALKEVWDLAKLKIVRSQFLPDRSFIVFD
jgi:hypothetical protein